MTVKTFKLKELQIVDYESDTYQIISVPLLDGLIINREDDENQWLVEAYTENKFLELFREYKEKYDELIIHVRITTEHNELATCISSVIGVNEIGDHMNVLFLGKMADQRTTVIEQELKRFIAEGEKGEELLKKLKATM
jgi:fatty acid-binding protein DegV